MGQPTPYSRAFSFTDYQTANPSEPLPGDQIDAELDGIERTLDETIANLALIQRDDGLLQNAVCSLDALDSDVLALIGANADWTVRGDWATGQDYAKYDIVKQGSPARSWLCMVAHTSGTFSTDEAAGKWTPLTAEQGPTGPTGATGATGAQGPAGNDGVITALASQAEAVAGTDNAKGMTPLRTRQAIDARATAFMGAVLLNGKIAASVSSNALTVAIKTLAGNDPSPNDPVYILLPDETQATGSPDLVAITSAQSITVPDTATLGTANSTPFRLWILGFNSGAAFAGLGLVNIGLSANGLSLVEGDLVSTTAVGTGADSAKTVYTSSALTNKPFRVLGYLDWTSGLATAGTWSAAPDIARQMTPGVPPPAARPPSIAVFENQQASGGAGPTFTSGAWRTYPFTTEVSDPDGIAALSSNRFTFTVVGTYRVKWKAAMQKGSSDTAVATRFQNVTSSATAARGLNASAPGTGVGSPTVRAEGEGVFTVTDTLHEYEVQVYPTANTVATGAASTGDVEVYAEVSFEKLA